MDLRTIWTTVVQADDFDRHMADNRQAAANGRLLAMQRFRELASPAFIAEAEVTAALEQRGYRVVWRAEQAVPDAKVMVALLAALEASSGSA
jgi:hypothetical protein